MKTFSKAILHIGLHKTGTSTLQEFLYSQRDALNDAGVYYPALQANLSQPLSSLFHDKPEAYSQNVLRGIDTEEKVREQNAQLLASLESEFDTAGADTLLLSGEDVCLLSHEALTRLKSWLLPRCDALTVVCVLRDPTGWSTSAAQSRIRGGETLAEVNEDHRVQRLKPLLETIAGALGHERMLWLDFQRLVTHPDNYVTAFLENLGLPADWCRDSDVRVVNEAISLEAAQVVSAINSQRPLYRDGKLNPERWHNDIGPICDGIPGRKFRLDEDTLMRIREAERPLLEWLDANFDFRFAASSQPAAGAVEADNAGFSQSAIESLALRAHDLERLKQ